MDPRNRDVFWRRIRQNRPEHQQHTEDESSITNQIEDHGHKRGRSYNAGPSEWFWFIATGLVAPFLFYFIYGVRGMLAGLLVFGLFTLMIYLSQNPEKGKRILGKRSSNFYQGLKARKQQLMQAQIHMRETIKRSVIRNIPGFRSQTLWKMVLASSFYIFAILIILVAIWQKNYWIAIILAVTGSLFISGTQDELP